MNWQRISKFRGIQGLTLKLRASEVLDDLLPIRRVFVATKIRLLFPAKDFECGALPDLKRRISAAAQYTTCVAM